VGEARPPPMAMAAAAVAKRCMNPACGAPATGGGGDWRKGWPLRSGGFALLCDKCGYGLLILLSVPSACPPTYPPPPASRLPNGEDASCLLSAFRCFATLFPLFLFFPYKKGDDGFNSSF
jgi:hypothetical protein